MKEIYLLQSGFVSTTDKGFFKYIAEAPSFRDRVLNKDNFGDIPEYFYHEGVTDIFTQYEANPRIIQKFEFRERIIEEAYKAFASSNIASWLQLQTLSPYFSDLHKGFIGDTFDYIRGNKRSMAISQWYSLIDATIAKHTVHFDYRSLYEDDPNKVFVPHEMDGFITQWLRQPGGYIDMLFSLWILFGRRDKQSTVSETKKREDGNILIGGAFSYTN